MGKFQNLFGMSDKLGMPGFLAMWFSFFTTSFVVLLADDTTGPSRDFCMVSQLLCCTNLASMGWAVANNESWSKANFFTLNFDTFGTLLAFAYFGGNDVLGSTTLGVWNSVQVVGTALNALFGISSLYMVATDYDGFREYLQDPLTTSNVVVDTSV
ncbi:MAG: hypothetical protein CMF69_11400 [Magnetovibrio sp.]|nr:hypothetical protein [Magnetovibrio sp.]|tara:strand:- start:687 stop:1154 length:468 start_codon:yes stop_codon:yes gene_type:complete